MGPLHTALFDPRTKDEAFGIIRTPIDEVRLIPKDSQLRVELRGCLFCASKSSWLRGQDLSPFTMSAFGRFIHRAEW